MPPVETEKLVLLIRLVNVPLKLRPLVAVLLPEVITSPAAAAFWVTARAVAALPWVICSAVAAVPVVPVTFRAVMLAAVGAIATALLPLKVRVWSWQSLRYQ